MQYIPVCMRTIFLDLSLENYVKLAKSQIHSVKQTSCNSSGNLGNDVNVLESWFMISSYTSHLRAEIVVLVLRPHPWSHDDSTECLLTPPLTAAGLAVNCSLT